MFILVISIFLIIIFFYLFKRILFTQRQGNIQNINKKLSLPKILTAVFLVTTIISWFIILHNSDKEPISVYSFIDVLIFIGFSMMMIFANLQSILLVIYLMIRKVILPAWFGLVVINLLNILLLINTMTSYSGDLRKILSLL